MDPAITPPGWRAMNQASVRRNWLVDSFHRCPLTSGMPPSRWWRRQKSLTQSVNAARSLLVCWVLLAPLAGVQLLQHADGAFDGLADDPGCGNTDGVVFSFEGQAGDFPAVDPAVLVPAD